MLADTVKYSTVTIFVVLIAAHGLGKIATAPSGASQGPPQSPQRTTTAWADPAPPPRPRAATAQPSGYKPYAFNEEHTIVADSRGHFLDTATINGQSVRVMVDTGASYVALSAEDAAALSIYPSGSDFSVQVGTANGVAHAAPVKLREVQLGSITLYDVDALVAERGAMSGTLLGMTFLSRLSKVEMGSGSLLLRK